MVIGGMVGLNSSVEHLNCKQGVCWSESCMRHAFSSFYIIFFNLHRMWLSLVREPLLNVTIRKTMHSFHVMPACSDINDCLSCAWDWSRYCRGWCTYHWGTTLLSPVIASLGGSVGCASDWWSGDFEFDPTGMTTFSGGESSWNLFYSRSLPSAD